jgi:MOSC domain-containing protein YiiM
MAEGRVEAIHIAAEHGELPQEVDRVEAHSGKGLVGNRYYWEDGSAPAGNALTLVAAEALEAFAAESGIELSGAASRRNVLTRGIDLNALVGKRFRVGAVECVGVELCEPCAHLTSLTYSEVLRGMVHRAGLNADMLNDGEIAVGDSVVPL